MNITLFLNLISPDIDQFYVVQKIRIILSDGIIIPGEVYNMVWIIRLEAPGIITPKIKFLRNLQFFGNLSFRSSCNVRIGKEIILKILLSMKISFSYGYFSYEPLLKTNEEFQIFASCAHKDYFSASSLENPY